MNGRGGSNEVSRPLVGVIALACLAAWLAMFFLPQQTDSVWQGSFLRVGLVMAAFWLALPARGRAAAWAGITPATLGTAVVAMFLAARLRWQALLPIIAGVIVVGLILRPRAKDRPRVRPAP